MSLPSVLARIQQIQQVASGAKTAPVAAQSVGSQPVTTESPVSASASANTDFAQILNSKDKSEIPVAAYRAAQPVQNGQLVQSLFAPRRQAAQAIANRFGLSVTSSYRTPQHNAEVGGVPGSYHTKGLAFDFVGSGAQMAQARAWAAKHPEMFQEVLVHDAGSGLHLHLAFRAS